MSKREFLSTKYSFMKTELSVLQTLIDYLRMYIYIYVYIQIWALFPDMAVQECSAFDTIET